MVRWPKKLTIFPYGRSAHKVPARTATEGRLEQDTQELEVKYLISFLH